MKQRKCSERTTKTTPRRRRSPRLLSKQKAAAAAAAAAAARKRNTSPPTGPTRPGSALGYCKKTDYAGRVFAITSVLNVTTFSLRDAMEVVGFLPEDRDNDRLQRRVLRHTKIWLPIIAERERADAALKIAERERADAALHPPPVPMIEIPGETDTTVSPITTPNVLNFLALVAEQKDNGYETTTTSVVTTPPSSSDWNCNRRSRAEEEEPNNNNDNDLDCMAAEDNETTTTTTTTTSIVTAEPSIGADTKMETCLAYLTEMEEERDNNGSSSNGSSSSSSSSNNNYYNNYYEETFGSLNEESILKISLDRLVKVEEENDPIMAKRRQFIYVRVYHRVELRLQQDENKYQDRILVKISHNLAERIYAKRNAKRNANRNTNAASNASVLAETESLFSESDKGRYRQLRACKPGAETSMKFLLTCLTEVEEERDNYNNNKCVENFWPLNEEAILRTGLNRLVKAEEEIDWVLAMRQLDIYQQVYQRVRLKLQQGKNKYQDRILAKIRRNLTDRVRSADANRSRNANANANANVASNTSASAETESEDEDECYIDPAWKQLLDEMESV